MTIEELIRERDERLAEAKQILDRNGNNDLTGSDATRFDELAADVENRNAKIKDLEHDRKLAEIRDAFINGGSGRYKFERGAAGDYDRDPVNEPHSAETRFRGRNPWDMSEVRTWGREPHEIAGELRGRALSAIEQMPGASDRIRKAATAIIEQHDDKRSNLARHALLTSSPAYTRAWSKMARQEQHLLTPEEVRAVEEVRAMSLTDTAGGYLAPFQLDPVVVISSNGSRSDIRMKARQVIATSDVWNGVSAGAVSWSWDAEASEVSDDSPTFAQPSIPIYTARGFVPISMEALQDEQNITEAVGMLLAQGKEDLEAPAFVTGSGSGQPTGIVTALTGGSSVVNATTDDTFALADVYKLQGALPARYRSNAAWLGNNLIYNLIRQFDTSGGAALWEYLGGDRPAQLLGRDVMEAEAMDGTITTSGAGHNYALVFGDWKHYVIADRLGLRVDFIPHLFHTANNRPSGQSGWFATYRVGADSTSDGAFRMLDVVSAS